MIRFQRLLDLSGRLCMVPGFLHPLWWVGGVFALGIAKILDNMEIGHNVLHGQYDWMNDPHINSRKFEWDNAGDSGSWKRYHNHEHHTYTNIIGKDRDYGYGLLRLSNDLPWRPKKCAANGLLLAAEHFYSSGGGVSRSGGRADFLR